MLDLKDAGAELLKMDVTDDASMVEGVDQMIKKHNRIDVLVNNAGYGSYGAIEDVAISEGKRQFEVNVFGLARLTQIVLPYMRKQRSGKIINMSSMGGKVFTPLGGWYHASKHALEGFSDCLRIEVDQFGIDVIVIEPGSIESEWGGIAKYSMIKASSKTAYSNFTQKVVAGFETNENGSPPQVIADVISKAIKAKKPKTRYAAGSFAKQFLFMRWLLPDRAFDAVLSNWLKLKS